MSWMILLNCGVPIKCRQCNILERIANIMKISKFSLVRCLWCGIATTIHKHGCLLSTKIMRISSLALCCRKYYFGDQGGCYNYVGTMS